jgi:hypothetical protein
MRNRLYDAAIVALGFGILPLSSRALAQPFAPVGPIQDSTTSLGRFSIVINPAFQAAFTGSSFYDSSTNILTSPLLYDPTTTINRSATTTVGSPAYNAGLPVGSAGGPVVGPGSLSALPSDFNPATSTGEDTVFTQINSFDLASGGWHARAGSAAAPTQPNASSGEVVSNATGGNIGNPANDFPAKSFFDIFVDISAPGLPGDLINNTPLIIENPSITSFPPQVIYTHGNSSAVPVVFASGPYAGDVLGLVTLAGHGAGYTSTDGSTGQSDNGPTSFNQSYDSKLGYNPDVVGNPSTGTTPELMPLPDVVDPTSGTNEQTWSTYVPAVPEPASLSLLAIGAASLGVRGRRKV